MSSLLRWICKVTPKKHTGGNNINFLPKPIGSSEQGLPESQMLMAELGSLSLLMLLFKEIVVPASRSL